MATGLNEKETSRWKKFYEKMMKSLSGVGEVMVLTTDKKKVILLCVVLLKVATCIPARTYKHTHTKQKPLIAM